jgi:pyrimidine deaminase RibD-like protein
VYESKLIYMKLCIEEAAQCRPILPREPRVGAALVNAEGELAGTAHRGELLRGEHAEVALIERKLDRDEITVGSTLYTTMEPCSSRNDSEPPCVDVIISPCVDVIIGSSVDRVVIGMLDPNPDICGRGYWRLIQAGIQVEFFPFMLAWEVLLLNREVLSYWQGSFPDRS